MYSEKNFIKNILLALLKLVIVTFWVGIKAKTTPNWAQPNLAKLMGLVPYKTCKFKTFKYSDTILSPFSHTLQIKTLYLYFGNF